MRRRIFRLLSLVLLTCSLTLVAYGQETASKPYVDVYFWFDTEDYLLPASDDAAKRLAELLTRLNVRATFKLVGEKARVLEARQRKDVIESLKQHDIGFHANYHSVQPTPALYLSRLGWDEGVREFIRREGPGVRDVARIFGMMPSCYGQPGSSWGPQQYGAMRHWGIPVYLDAGRHVQLDGKPFWYCGILHLYALTATTRCELGAPEDLEQAKREFERYYRELTANGGGPVSIVYHPCEFVHAKFWDGVNFSRGANPARSRWKIPPMKSKEQIERAFSNFERYVRFIADHPNIRFTTARDAVELYPDRSLGHQFDVQPLAETAIERGVTWQVHDEIYALSASEVFLLMLAGHVARLDGDPAPRVRLPFTPLGPTEPVIDRGRVQTDGSQFNRTARDVLEYVRHHRRVPPAVWLGSQPVGPESFFMALARYVARGETPGDDESIVIEPAELAAEKYVASDRPELWGWVIFPPGFRAPEMMALAKRQAWTLKPAIRIR